MIAVAAYGRHWAVYAGEELVCVCLYKKGAREVKRRLEMAGKNGATSEPGSSWLQGSGIHEERKSDSNDNPTA